MTRLPWIVVAAVALGLAAAAQEKPEAAPAKVEGKYEEAAWGKAKDLEGDCKFQFTKPSTLTIVVPGTVKPHDLAAEIKVINAPRMLQPVQGDFNAQVKVDGEFQPGGESTQPGRTGYTGAALIFMADPQNVVTLARAALQRPDGVPVGYVNFEVRSQGRLEHIGTTDQRPITSDKPLYLRMERRGRQVLGFVSEDGEKWESLTPKDLPEGWPEAGETGVAAISTSWGEFKPEFTDLKVEQGAAVPKAGK